MKLSEIMPFKYLKFVQYKDLKSWDIRDFFVDKKIYTNFTLEKLSFFVEAIKSPISKEEVNKLCIKIISKINFGGELFLRNFEEIETYKGNLFRVSQNQIIFSKINARHGCIYFHDQNFQFAVSSEYPTLTFNHNVIDGDYLKLVLRSKHFQALLKSKSTGHSKARVTSTDILNLKIPLPPLAIQAQIVSTYQAAIAAAEAAEQQAAALEKEIEQYLNEALGIEVHKTERKKGLQFVQSKDLTRWGVAFILGEEKEPFFGSIYPLVSLPDFVEINPTTSFKHLSNNMEITFTPMECVSDKDGEIKEYRLGKISDGKGYTKFAENDLIWAKITPCMENGKSAIAKNLSNGFGYGSTEFHVFRTKSAEIKIEYLHCLFRTEYLKGIAKKNFAGSAGQQRVPTSFFTSLQIPLPPLAVQQAIVAKISAMKSEIKMLKTQAIAERDKAKRDFENVLFSRE